MGKIGDLGSFAEVMNWSKTFLFVAESLVGGNLFIYQATGVFCRNWAVRNPDGTRLDSPSLVNKQVGLVGHSWWQMMCLYQEKVLPKFLNFLKEIGRGQRIVILQNPNLYELICHPCIEGDQTKPVCFMKKNYAYGRQSISGPMRIVAPIPQ